MIVSKQNHFANVPHISRPRSTFNRSHGHKTTFDAGYLVPIFCDEVLPGDTFNLRMTAFARMATPIFPLMDNLYMEFFFFFVPCRLVWEKWQRFMGEQPNPGDSINFSIPTCTNPWATGGFDNMSLHDYFGLPTLVTGNTGGSTDYVFNNLPFRAYNLIWNEWFRDENLQNRVPVPLGDGPDNPADFVLKRRGKRKDYFTSALPFLQKGPAATMPLGTDTPVHGIGYMYQTIDRPGALTDMATSQMGYPDLQWTETYRQMHNSSDTDKGLWIYGPQNAIGGDPASWLFVEGEKVEDEYYPKIYASLSTAIGPTINEVRQAFQIQRFLEKDARGGTRYIELILSHFGVRSSDARLQRPELLGTGRTMININPIAQTSGAITGEAVESATPQGNVAAYATAGARAGFVKSFEEHGYVIGLVSVRADLNYQYGLHKMWTRSTRFDFYWPVFAHLGEQAVSDQELFCTGVPGNRQATFGYQERYAEYRYKPSQITGKFRSNDPVTLDAWHLAQETTFVWPLVGPFIEENPPMERVVAVPSEPHFIFDSVFDYKCARPMPVYSPPGLIDHF